MHEMRKAQVEDPILTYCWLTFLFWSVAGLHLKVHLCAKYYWPDNFLSINLPYMSFLVLVPSSDVSIKGIYFVCFAKCLL